uniref:Uncharacterized protein n=1 Tax=Oryza meridionalis TaxID=40149 RepID=A0A0E0C7K0_9ORYZ
MLPTAELLAVIGSRQSWNHELYPIIDSYGGRLDEHGAADGDGNLSGRRSNSGCAEVGGQTAAEERGEIQRAAAIAAQGQIRRAQAGSGRPAATPSVSSLLGPPLRSAPRGRRDREAPVDGDLHEDDCEGE